MYTWTANILQMATVKTLNSDPSTTTSPMEVRANTSLSQSTALNTESPYPQLRELHSFLHNSSGDKVIRMLTNFSGDTVTLMTTPPDACQTDHLVDFDVTHGVSQAKVVGVIFMLLLFSLFGCFGNGLVLYVFSKKSDKVTSTIFILALAWTDFLTCLFFMPFTVTFIQLRSRLYTNFFCKLYQFFNTSNVPLSAFIMVAIAVDRYFSICHPFLHVVTPRRARLTILCLVLTAFTFGSITACIYSVHQPCCLTDGIGYYNTSESCSELVQSLESHPGPDDRDSPDLSNLATNSSDPQLLIISTVTLSQLFNNDTPSHNQSHSRNLRCRPPEHASARCDPNNNYEGLCTMNEFIFSMGFIEKYQKVYISLYIMSLVAVFTLYFFIYKSVAERRAWRRKQKSWSHSPLSMTGGVTTADDCTINQDLYTREGENLELSPHGTSTPESGLTDLEDTQKDPLTPTLPVCSKTSSFIQPLSISCKLNCNHQNGLDSSFPQTSAEKKTNRERRDFNFLANIRTALMLFVVTLVFIFSFLPAWLMATQILDFEIIIFYMHFVYNVANPVIYAFMNQSFRKELKRVFHRGTRSCFRRCSL